MKSNDGRYGGTHCTDNVSCTVWSMIGFALMLYWQNRDWRILIYACGLLMIELAKFFLYTDLFINVRVEYPVILSLMNALAIPVSLTVATTGFMLFVLKRKRGQT